MTPKEKSNYKKVIIFLVVAIILYIFIGIGDVIIKGSSNLPFWPFFLVILVLGWLIGIYVFKSKNKR